MEWFRFHVSVDKQSLFLQTSSPVARGQMDTVIPKESSWVLDQPFCPRCLPLVFLPYLSTVFRFKWLLGGRCVDVTKTSCLSQWSSSLEVVLYFILCAWPYRNPILKENNLFEVFWTNGANGSCFVPSPTSLPKTRAAFLLSTFSLPTLCLLFDKNHFKHWLFKLGIERGIMADIKIIFHALLSKKASGSCLFSDYCEWKLKTMYIMRIFRQIKFFSWDLLVCAASLLLLQDFTPKCVCRVFRDR